MRNLKLLDGPDSSRQCGAAEGRILRINSRHRQQRIKE